MLNKSHLAAISLIIVALGYSLLSIASRLLALGFDDMTQVYMRIFFGLLIAMVILRKRISYKKFLNLKSKDIFWLMMMGVVGYTISVYFITLSVLNTKLVNFAVIYSTIPLVAYFYSYFLLKKKINCTLFGSLFITMYAILVMTSKSFIPSFGDFGIGEVYAVIAVLCAGFWSVGRKMLSKKLNNSEITVFVMIVATLVGFFISQLKGETIDIIAIRSNALLVFIGLLLGSSLNMIASFLENYAFEHIDAVLGNQILMLDSIFSLVVGYLFYNEVIGVTELIGSAIILTTVVISNKVFLEK